MASRASYFKATRADKTSTFAGGITINQSLTFGDALVDTITINGLATVTTNQKIQFRDTGIYINSGADGKLTISADGVGLDDITLAGSVTLSDKVVAGTSSDAGGIALTTAQPRGIAYYAELASAGTALDGGTVSRGIYCRYVVNKAQTNDVSLYATQGHLRLKASLANGINCGISGYVEQSGAVAVTPDGYLTGGHFSIETDASFTLASAARAGGIVIESRMVGGTINGKAGAICLRTNGGATAFPNLLVFDAVAGCVSVASVGGSQSHKIAIDIGGTPYYIPLNTA